jgi:hypothetical protein
MPTSERITSVTVANYNWDAIPAAERTDEETFSVASN